MAARYSVHSLRGGLGQSRGLCSWSVASLLSALLVAVLLCINGRPAPGKLSDMVITTLINVLSAMIILLLGFTVMVGMSQPQRVLLDETPTARQGGARKFLACLLMMAIVAVYPTTQAIFRRTSFMLRAGVAKIPLSTAFAAFENYPDGRPSYDTFLSITAVNAIYNGFFGSPVPFDTECPSGECSWDKPYTTLALCSSCANITSSLSPYRDDDGEEVGVKLDNGFFLRYNNIFGLPMGERQMYSNMNSTAQHSNVFGNLVFSDYSSIAYEDVPGKFHTMFAIVGSTPESAVHMSEAPQPAAYECMLQWCLQQYTAKMTNGQLNETLVNVINDTTVTDTSGYSLLSRQLTDPATKQLYNVSKLSEFTLSNILMNLVNDSRVANVSGDATPSTVLWDAIARPEKVPSALYSHLAHSLSTFMRVNNSAIVLANYSSAEGDAVEQQDVVEVSGTSLSYLLMVLLSCGLFALMAARKSSSEVSDSCYFDDASAEFEHRAEKESHQQASLL